MDWELVFMVFLGWVVSGGLMYLVYKLGNDSVKEYFQDSPGSSNTLNHKKEWRIWLNGMVAIVVIAFFGFFFDERGPNAHMPSHLLGMYLAAGLAYTVGWFDGRRMKNSSQGAT